MADASGTWPEAATETAGGAGGRRQYRPGRLHDPSSSITPLTPGPLSLMCVPLPESSTRFKVDWLDAQLTAMEAAMDEAGEPGFAAPGLPQLQPGIPPVDAILDAGLQCRPAAADVEHAVPPAHDVPTSLVDGDGEALTATSMPSRVIGDSGGATSEATAPAGSGPGTAAPASTGKAAVGPASNEFKAEARLQ